MIGLKSAAPLIEAPFPIVIDNIGFVYEQEQKLDGVSLAFEPGEHVALCGPNGSGKSLLLNLIAGRGGINDKSPTNGDIYYGDVPIYSLRRFGRTSLINSHIAYLEQTPVERLFPEETVETNLRLSANFRNVTVNEYIFADVVDYYGLNGMLKRPARVLSGGQKQILPIASKEITDPAVLVLDEPLAPLSPEMAHKVDTRLATLATKGKIVMTVDHRLNPQASRIIRLEQGKIVSDITNGDGGFTL